MPTLNRHERMFWPPELTLLDPEAAAVTPQPAATAWEASFDGGSTWVASRAHPSHADWPCWLIQGPEAPAGPTVDATISDYITVLIRLVDTPEVIVTTIRAELSS